jgi:RNA polymerase sigma-70 factor (ECF subfamily)
VPLAAVPEVDVMSVMAPDDSLPDGLSDEALLAGMAAGAVAAGTAFVRRHQSRLFGLAWVLVGDPGLAEDVVQEVFLRAWLHGASFDARKGSVRSWLSTITRNLAIDTLRMHQAEPMDPDALLAQLALADGDPSDHITRLEDAEQVRAAVRELPAPQQRALVLARWFGRTAEEISKMEQIPLGTAKTRIRTATLQLRSTLAEETRR